MNLQNSILWIIFLSNSPFKYVTVKLGTSIAAMCREKDILFKTEYSKFHTYKYLRRTSILGTIREFSLKSGRI